MNFTFIKMSFDCSFSLLFVNLNTTGQIISTGTSIGIAIFTLSYPTWLAYQGGMYMRELKAAESDDKV